MTGRIMLYVLAFASVSSAWAEGGKMENVVQQMFDSANKSDEAGLVDCFSENALVRIVSMEFRGKKAILAFFKRDVWGGHYTIEKSFKKTYGEDVHLLFKPSGWSQPEPPILYAFYIQNNKIDRLVGTYR